jgi:hypothetical protein
MEFIRNQSVKTPCSTATFGFFKYSPFWLCKFVNDVIASFPGKRRIKAQSSIKTPERKPLFGTHITHAAKVIIGQAY